MQDVSALYEDIASSRNHFFEYKLVIDGAGTYGEDKIFSMRSELKMFSGTPEIGKAVAGEISIKMLPPPVELPTMATLRPYSRVCDSGRQSEWIPQGVFYIDTRERTKNNDNLSILSIHGYDAMLKAEQPFASSTVTGDSIDTDMVDAIASIMGVQVDPRTYTLMTNAYTIPLPVGYTCREVLGYIASMYVGCFIMSDAGKLRLVSILDLPPETNYLIDNEGDSITFGGDRILV